ALVDHEGNGIAALRSTLSAHPAFASDTDIEIECLAWSQYVLEFCPLTSHTHFERSCVAGDLDIGGADGASRPERAAAVVALEGRRKCIEAPAGPGRVSRKGDCPHPAVQGASMPGEHVA